LAFTKAFDFYCIDVKKYMPNTAGRAIKFIKTVCRDARISGIETNLHLDSIKGYTRKTGFIILTPSELELIEKHEFKNATLDNARDWLVISCYSGQRVSDFLRFNENMLVEVETPSGKKALMIEFTQVKTNKEMRLPLHPKIINIIKKRDGKFPNKLSDQRYNEYIKMVCKEVGLTQMVKGSKVDQETNRKQSGRYEKWELITSHIGRRSFASNNYGKLQTPLIMYATGHTTEKMLLNYIGKTNEDKAFELLKYMEL
jgi:integrase